MTKISRTTALLAAFGFLILSLILFVFLIKPLYATIMALRISTVQIVGDIEQKEDAISKIQALVAKYQNLSEIRDLFSQSLPHSIDSAAITGEMNLVAQKNLLAVESIAYEAISVSSLPDPMSNTKYGYGGMRVRVLVIGSYVNIKSFISGLESSLRIFDIKTIRFESSDERLALQGIIKAEVTFNTYYQSNQETNPLVKHESIPALQSDVKFR